MRCLLRKIIRQTSDGTEYQNSELSGSQITIGRGTDQTLFLPGDTIGLKHAVITQRDGDRVYIKSLRTAGMQVNGKPRRDAELAPGDVITLGPHELTLDSSDDHDLTLLLKVGDTNDTERPGSQYTASLYDAGLRKTPWSWLLTLVVVVSFLLIPLAAYLMPDLRDDIRQNDWLLSDASWTSGPLHPAHGFIGDDCNACHQDGFVMVQNEQCQTCHADTTNHVHSAHFDMDMFGEQRCGQCHKEHNEPEILVRQDQYNCTHCHEQLQQMFSDSSLRDVGDFGNEHPDFHLTMLTPERLPQGGTDWSLERYSFSPALKEDSNLKFSHKQHLTPEGLTSPQGNQVLTCDSCHQPDPAGRLMAPVNMEQHCSDCHSLRFDNSDRSKEVPHGEPQQVVQSLIEYYSWQYLQNRQADTQQPPSLRQARRPGQATRKPIVSKADLRRALSWANEQANQTSSELFEKRLCVDCHVITKLDVQEGLQQWRVEPVRLTLQWMPYADYDHFSHRIGSCIDCHKAETSEHSSDVLMPHIEDCQICHGGAEASNKVASTCIMCHKYHVPGMDPMEMHVIEGQVDILRELGMKK